MSDPKEGYASVSLPRVTIRFCTACKWNLRAAYYAQELLQTLGDVLGEVALVPGSKGEFVVEVYIAAAIATGTRTGTGTGGGNGGGWGERDKGGEGRDGEQGVRECTVWNRKTDGGFPETKELKRRVRDLVDRERGLGHVDRDYGGKEEERGKEKEQEKEQEKGKEGGGEGNVRDGQEKKGCDDCK